MTKNRLSKWERSYLILIFLIMYLPILFLVGYSFNDGNTMSAFTGFTFKHYQTLFHDIRLLTIVVNTFIVALLSALIATMIGTMGAIMIYYTKSYIEKQMLLNLNAILMVSPDVIIGASFLIMFTYLGIKLGMVSVLLAHIAFNIPIVVLMVLPRLEELNPSIVLAAKDLGATTLDIVTKILLPILTPGILAGFFMAFTYSLDDFAVTFFVTGNGFSTLAVEIYSRARTGIKLEVNALSTFLFLFSLLMVLGYYLVTQYETKRKRGQ